MVTRVIAWLTVLSSVFAMAFSGWLWMLTAPNGLPHLGAAQANPVVLGWGGLGLAWAVIGAVLVTARPHNAFAWLLLAVGVSQAWHVGLVTYAIYGLTVALPPWPAALWVGYAGEALFGLGVLATLTLLLAFYPEGRLPAAWWRWPVGAAAVAIVHITAQGLFLIVGNPRQETVVLIPDFLWGIPVGLVPESLRDQPAVWITGEPLPAWVGVIKDGYLPLAEHVWAPLFLLCTVVIWVGTVVRLLRAPPQQRQQLVWLVCVVLPLLVAAWLAPSAGRLLLILGLLLLVPVALAVGLHIKVVLRRGLVYGTLTVLVVAVYLVVTALAGMVLDRRPLPGVLAAAVVAVGLAPARDRLQRAADRLIYGERRDPLRAISQLGQRVAATGEVDLLTAALGSVTDAVRAPGAAVVAPDGRILAAVGAEPVTGAVVPLEFGGRRLGELRVAAPRVGEAYTDADVRLLAGLALQVQVVVRALELTEALAAERDRVVTATTTERDRLRQDLHDGLGPSLSGVGLGLQALTDRLEGADPTAAVLVDRLQAEIATAIIEVRCIIDNLRPAPLGSLVLTEALRRHADTVSAALPVHVDAAPLPVLPPDIETAAYRITTEALINAARHADAHRIRLSIAASDAWLRITVEDDGHGVGQGAGVTSGVGLTSMRRRAETLGGHLHVASAPTGTTVIATLPVEQL